MTAKSKSVKGTERKSDGRALKVVELIAGDLPGCFGALPGLGGSQGSLIAGQKSAEGVVPGRAGHWPLDTGRPERNGAASRRCHQMDGERQNQEVGQQLELTWTPGAEGEARSESGGRAEPDVSGHRHESPTEPVSVMQEVLSAENLRVALRQVQGNKGSPGIDGMTVEELPAYLKAHWPGIKEQLMQGRYRPQPVKRVEIPKPDGGVRKLGIPTVLDRFIQQAVLQVLQKRWDKTFSESSFGFRPKRSAHQAVAAAQRHIASGRTWVVDIDLEKFFDRVNHDRLMGRIMQRENDKPLLKLIRAYLNAGVMENGVVVSSEEGTPQGGPLSPLLSNLVLDELDKELEKRGHAFVRYADDCNIYVHSERAGQRVMEGVSRFITAQLKLKVNTSKSAVARPSKRKFLGFSFTSGQDPKRRIAP